MKRKSGFYYVEYKGKQMPGYYIGNEKWSLPSHISTYIIQEGYLDMVGPRIPTRLDIDANDRHIASLEKSLNDYANRNWYQRLFKISVR